MKKFNHNFFAVFSLLLTNTAFSQEPKFTVVPDTKETGWGTIYSIAQDKQGRLWLGTERRGVFRYDGKKFTNFQSDSEIPNSIVGSLIVSINIDSSGLVWMCSVDYGVNRYDPVSNTFTHFRHNPKDPFSLSNDTLFASLTDRAGNVWIGTNKSLDMYDRKSGKFLHYGLDSSYLVKNDIGPFIYAIYEDKQGVIWIGWGNPFVGKKEGPGGLTRLDRTTGKMIHYKHNPSDPTSLSNNNVSAIYEDNKGNFWVGTKGDGLHMLDRATGKFTLYKQDSLNTGKLSRPPLPKNPDFDMISFITEDINGNLWIGSLLGGINRYDPATKKTTHYGTLEDDKTNRFAKDTLTGFTSTGAVRAFQSKDNVMWFTGNPNGLYKRSYNRTTIPYYAVKGKSGATFHHDPVSNTLWIGADTGIIKKDLATQREKFFSHDPKNANSLSQNGVVSIRADEEGHLWIGTHYGGLNKFNPKTEKFTHFRYDSTKTNSLVSDGLHCLFFDHEKTLWIGTHAGLSAMNIQTGSFTNYKNDSNDSTSISPSTIYSISEDKDFNIWTSGTGVNKLNRKTGKFKRYLNSTSMISIFVDTENKVWTGGSNGLFYYDPAKDIFSKFRHVNFPEGMGTVKGIVEDDKKNLWISTLNALIKINQARNELKAYKASSGVKTNSLDWMHNYKAKDGKLFFEADSGYYSFYPDDLVEAGSAILLQITGLRIGDKEIVTGQDDILNAPIWDVEKISLNYNQNTFSFDFNAIDYETAGDIKYIFRLENYESNWHETSGDGKATFFNVKEGNYVFRVKAVNDEGVVAEKSIIVIITPPWWKTWWAYSLYVSVLLAAGWGIYKYQKQRIIKVERERSRLKELAQAKEIEKAYTVLKTTQAQLVQSEKMASLGELTAGIAHEIQNPLNFVNNFSEVNKELITELKAEIKKGNMEEVNAIANDIEANEEKINHHGKRADAIVKGMLQHSRSSSGQKEPTDINALADEYLRLAYHGLRAKDKSFNANFNTDFDDGIGKVDIVPQDLGRVVLNLINNAFYAVDEKKKMNPNGYEPTVSISTKREKDKIEIKVKDNGNGIPQKVLDKIFQPFFTTKPTGQGTGLGLSLSYDIVKAHGGELQVNSKEREGAEFIIQLPLKTTA